MRSAVFIDRDGTIVEAFKGRPANTVEEIALLPGAADGIQTIKRAGLLVVVVTNQGGVGLGYMDEDTLVFMNDKVNELLSKSNAPKINAFYCCTHRPDARCECRKPKPGMLVQAAKDLDIDLHSSFMVGDAPSDMAAAIAAGVRWPLMVVSDSNADKKGARLLFPNFLDAAKMVVAIEASRRLNR